ncbi:MAG: glycosyltransferase family 2 protein [Methanobrevibacter sp.]|jgi:glycosyltransferase involved in cell wall biosynthesis|nr:glycosyltransferase family 2 protein [Candidatus Methanovirga basalitermitum]
MNVIIIIPAFNEEDNIKDVASKSLEYGDVLVVDDGSTDNTKKNARSSGAKVISHENNKGKGFAIKTGIKEALKHPYEVFIFIDGDGQHDPNLIQDFMKKMDSCDIVIGSRFLKGELKNMPIQRKLSNLITTKLISFITEQHLTDSQSGFRGVSKEMAEHFLKSPYNDYRFESDVLINFLSKIRYDEVSIPSRYGEEVSHITHTHTIKYVFFISKNVIKNMINKFI